MKSNEMTPRERELQIMAEEILDEMEVTHKKTLKYIEMEKKLRSIKREMYAIYFERNPGTFMF